MKITNLERASNWEVKKWLEKEFELTPYQKEKLNEDFIRFSPFYFYKRPKKENVSILWRLTVIVFPFYFITLFCFLPVNYLFTGKWGYNGKFIDNFHSKWIRKLNF